MQWGPPSAGRLGVVLLALLALLALVPALACTGDASSDAGARTGEAIEVVDAIVAAPPTGSETSVYFTVLNSGAPDTLVALSASVADSGSIHTVVDEGGMTRMEPLAALAIPGGGEVRLEPGVLHGMLTGLRSELTPGDSVILILEFARAGAVVVRAAVVSYADVLR